MDTNKLINLINIALNEADQHVIKYYKGDEKPMLDTKKVLFLLKEEVESNSESMNERVLRAMHDIGAMSVKIYENAPLDNAIGNIVSMLYHTIPQYKKLQPLRSDFGKGQPI